jgi:hypothetical protein
VKAMLDAVGAEIGDTLHVVRFDRFQLGN